MAHHRVTCVVDNVVASHTLPEVQRQVVVEEDRDIQDDDDVVVEDHREDDDDDDASFEVVDAFHNAMVGDHNYSFDEEAWDDDAVVVGDGNDEVVLLLLLPVD